VTAVSAPPRAPDAGSVAELARPAAELAGAHADDVDRRGRFPAEAVQALQQAGLLSCAVPVHLGGQGLNLAEVGALTELLGRHCASTAMIFAMHQIQVFCLVRHHHSATGQQLLGEIVRDQLLLASATTEIGIGGDVRSSSCAVQREGDQFRLVKNAPVISYGEHADVVLATARRNAESPPSDQVLVICRPPGLVLERTGTWDTLGFRGTCSPGYLLTATGTADLVLTEPYAEISARSMLPVSHVLWAYAWLGIAEAATDLARRSTQRAARSRPDAVSPAAVRLAHLFGTVAQFRHLVTGSANSFDAVSADDDVLTGIGFSLAMNNLKVTASGLVVDVVGQALGVCGIAGYRQDSEFSMGRHLRDAFGAPLMVSNDRIMANNAQLALVHRGVST